MAYTGRAWMKITWGLGLVALVGLAIGGYASAATTHAPRALKKTSGSVTIGVIEHETGPSAYYGLGEIKAFKSATAYLNTQGGILGKKINLKILDDGDNPALSANDVRTLAGDSSISVILGPTNAPDDEADSPVASSLKIPEIYNAGGVTSLKGGWGWIVFPPYGALANITLNTFFGKETHLKTAALLTQSNNVAFTALVPVIQADLKKLGVKLVANVEYPEGTTNFSSYITTFMAAKPSVVLLDMIDTDAATFMVQARSTGLTSRWVVPNNSEATSTLATLAGKSAIGMISPALFNPDSRTADFSTYKKWTHKLYHAALDPTTIYGWDSVLLLREVVDKAGAFNRQKIENALKSTTSFVGAAGPYKRAGTFYEQQAVGLEILTASGYVPWSG